MDSHPHWAASQVLSESWEAGAVGQVYYPLSNDSDPTDGLIGDARKRLLGGAKSHVASAGPKLGRVFKLGKQTGYPSLRGCWKCWAWSRLEGCALFATINRPLGQQSRLTTLQSVRSGSVRRASAGRFPTSELGPLLLLQTAARMI